MKYLFLINTAFAQGTFEITNPLGAKTISDILAAVGGYFFGVAGALAAIMILYGAFQMLFSAGDPKKFETGKQTLLYAAIGFTIVLLASGIGSLVKSILGGGTNSGAVPADLDFPRAGSGSGGSPYNNPGGVNTYGPFGPFEPPTTPSTNPADDFRGRR